MPTQTRRIDIQVTTNDSLVKKLGNSLADMNKELKKSGDALSSLRSLSSSIAGATIFGFGVREITTMVDSMVLLESRILSLTGSIDKTKVVMESLKNIAAETKLGIADTAESFTRIATATINLNLPTKVQLDLTKGLIQSFRLAGATAQEAAGATIQFGQALSFGKLSGQELRSVTSQNAIVANILNKSIQGTGLSLKEFAEKGKLTTAFLINTLLPAFKELDAKANKMEQTFSQTLVLATNRLTIKLAELNKEFNLNGKFAQMMEWLLDHGDDITALLVSLAVSVIPKLTLALYEMATAALANPYVLLATAIAGLTFAAIEASGGVGNLWKNIKLLNNSVDTFNFTGMQVWFGQTGESAEILKNKLEDLRAERDRIRNGTDDPYKAKQNQTNTSLLPQIDFGSPDQLFPNKMVLKAEETFKMAEKATHNWKEEIGALNAEFNKSGDAMKVWDYNAKLLSLSTSLWNEEMKKGEISLKRVQENINKLKMENLVREFEYGVSSMEELDLRIKELKIEELRIKFEKGKTSAAEFYNELAKLQTGFNGLDIGIKGGLYNIKENISSASSQISSVVNSMSKSFEDNFFNMIDKHQYDFSNFVDSVLEDLTRMVIRLAVIAPLAQGFLGMMGLGGLGSGSGNSAGGGGGGAVYSANGTAWDNGVQAYASGGIVSKPTLFGHAGGMGIMGEAGPEAILPLKRNGGELGVAAAPVNVNIINQSGGEVQTNETKGSDGSRVIEVLILGKVKEGIANGTFDQSMKANYGLQRRGV